MLTIAHRVNTILDSDRVMVMEQGRISEFDTPQALLSNPSGKFSDLVQTTFGVSPEDVMKNRTTTISSFGGFGGRTNSELES